MKSFLTSFFFFCLVVITARAQAPEGRHFLERADTLDKTRFWTSAIAGTAIYSGFAVLMWQSWYQDYELTGFHSFDDLKEWNQVDKAGHTTTAYIECRYSFNGALWTGMNRRKAMWTAAGIGTLLQLTVETMDGFSEKWGFSYSDFGFNTLGVGLFVTQELIWQEQPIKMKISSTPFSYPDLTVTSAEGNSYTLKQRADELFGTSPPEKFLKDYNAQNSWASVNLGYFLPEESRFPKWLNVAVGYGAGNLYGGFANEWFDEEDNYYYVHHHLAPRYRRLMLSLDVDLSRIQTKSRVLNTVFDMINWIKIPAPTLEYRTTGQWKFHPIYW